MEEGEYLDKNEPQTSHQFTDDKFQNEKDGGDDWDWRANFI